MVVNVEHFVVTCVVGEPTIGAGLEVVGNVARRGASSVSQTLLCVIAYLVFLACSLLRLVRRNFFCRVETLINEFTV